MLPLLCAYAWWRRARAGAQMPRAFVVGAATVAVAALSAAGAAAPTAAWEALRPLVLIAAPAWCLGATAFGSDRAKAVLSEAMAWAGTGVALIGLAQATRLDGFGSLPASEIDWSRFGPAAAFLRAAYEGAAAFDPAKVRAALPAWASFAAPLCDLLPVRPFGGLPRTEGPPPSTLGHANLAAEIVAAGLAAQLVRLRAAWRAGAGFFGRCASIPVSAARVAALVAGAAYLHHAAARGPVLALAAVVAALAAAFVFNAPPGTRLRRATWALAAAAVCGGAFYALDRAAAVRGDGPAESLFARFRQMIERPTAARDTLAERLALWDNTGAMIRDGAELGDLRRSPVLGVGAGNWEVAYPLFARAEREHAPATFRLGRRPDHAHADPLEWFAETGFLGLLCGAALVAAALAAATKGARSGRAERRDATFGLVAPIGVLAAASCVSFPFATATPLVWAGLAYGALVAPRPDASSPGGDRGGAAAGLAALFVAGAAAWAGARFGAALAAAVGALLWPLLPVRPGRFSALRWTVAAVGVGAAGYAVYMYGGPFDRLTLAAAVGAAAAAFATGGDGRFLLRPGACRALAVVCVLLGVVGAFGGRARIAASQGMRAGGERTRAAQLVPAERSTLARAAADLLDAATARGPASFLVEMRRADAYAALGALGDAERSARRALRLNPGFANPYALLGNVAFARGAVEEARRFAEEALRRCGSSAEARTLIGRALVARGDDRAALAEFEAAVEEAEKRWAPYAKIAAAELRLRLRDDPARALVWLEQARYEAAQDPYLLEKAAALLASPQFPPEAQATGRALWREIATRFPERPRARFEVAVEPLFRPDGDAARGAAVVAALDALLDELPADMQAEARLRRAEALALAGRFADAERGYRDAALAALRLTPDDPADDVVAAEAIAGAERARAAAAAESRPAASDAAASRPAESRRASSRPASSQGAATRPATSRPTTSRPAPARGTR